MSHYILLVMLLFQCELVYTFFHPLLRDEQEAQRERLSLPKLRGKSLWDSETQSTFTGPKNVFCSWHIVKCPIIWLDHLILIFMDWWRFAMLYILMSADSPASGVKYLINQAR